MLALGAAIKRRIISVVLVMDRHPPPGSSRGLNVTGPPDIAEHLAAREFEAAELDLRNVI
jgi:hypothetical protein